MAIESTGSNLFPKWQIAIALSSTGILGLGYWCLKKYSQNDLTPVDKGDLYYKNGRYEEAIIQYSKAIKECPLDHKTDLSKFYYNRAVAYAQLRKWSRVIRDCTMSHELNQQCTKVLFLRAQAFEFLKDWRNSLIDINRVCFLQGFQDEDTLVMADRLVKKINKIFTPSRCV